MGALVTLSFETGRVGFGDIVRGADEAGHDVFEVELLNHRKMFGEWRHKWADNHADFDVEISDFGYPSATSIGIPGARLSITQKESAVVENLVRALFLNAEATKRVSSFCGRRSKFLGHVHFTRGWFQDKNRTRIMPN